MMLYSRGAQVQFLRFTIYLATSTCIPCTWIKWMVSENLKDADIPFDSGALEKGGILKLQNGISRELDLATLVLKYSLRYFNFFSLHHISAVAKWGLWVFVIIIPCVYLQIYIVQVLNWPWHHKLKWWQTSGRWIYN